LPFQLILECPSDIFGGKTSSNNLVAVWIEETLDSSKCFVELGFDLVSLLESERLQGFHEVLSKDLGAFSKKFGS